MKKALKLSLGLLSLSLISQAALIPTLETTGPGDTMGSTKYFYTVSLATDEQIGDDNPAVLVVYDFAGYVADSLVIGVGAGSWDFMTQAVGPYPTGSGDLESGDSPAPNFVFTYDDVLLEGDGSVVLSFTADSRISKQTLGDFQAMDGKNSPNPIEEGTPATNEGNVAVPDPAGQQGAIPEPATMLLMGGALVSLGLFRKKIAIR